VVALGVVRRTLALALLVISNLCLALALGVVRRILAVALLRAVRGAHLALALLVTSNLCFALALRDNHLVRRTKL
jgi:hypothetical protein